MPSPLGHVFSGVIIASVQTSTIKHIGLKRLSIGAIAASAPDLDMVLSLFGFNYFYTHRTFSHSITMVLGVFILLWALNHYSSKRYNYEIPYVVVPTCITTHILLDFFGEDTYGPRGLMVLWPFLERFLYLNINLFSSPFSPDGDPLPLLSLLLIGIEEFLIIGFVGVPIIFISKYLRKNDTKTTSI